MRRTRSLFMMVASVATGWVSPTGAQELLPSPHARAEAARVQPPPLLVPPVPLYASPPPFSRDARLRDQQAVARQRAVLDWTRWQSNAWSMYGPDELWLFGPPLTFAWEFPPVEQPIGYQRIYDGRGGYSSGPVYADQVSPLRPGLALPPIIRAPVPEAEPEVASRRPSASPAGAAAARTAEAPRRLFSW